jgi:hypothetical protein
VSFSSPADPENLPAEGRQQHDKSCATSADWLNNAHAPNASHIVSAFPAKAVLLHPIDQRLSRKA